MPAGYESANGTFDVESKTVFINAERLKGVPDYEKLLFDKILEYRNEFVDYFYTYMTTGKYGKRTYEDFVKSFNKQYDKLLKK